MSSQTSSSSIFSQEYLDSNIDESNLEVLWETTTIALAEATEPADFQSILHTIKSSLVNCLKYVAIDDLQTKLLRHAMPATLKLFQESFKQIRANYENNDENAIERIKTFLKICNELLHVMDDTLAHIISWSQVETVQIASLLETVAAMLLESYQHCKESEINYGMKLERVKELLTALFRKTGDVQNRFYILLNNVLGFNVECDEAVRLLVSVINVLSEIGELVIQMDLKTMAEHWRGFTKLVQQHAEIFGPYINLAPSMTFLSAHIMDILNDLRLENNEMKFIMRQLKSGSFILRIIISLCEIYGNNSVGDNSMIIDLLLSLYRYSPSYLQLQKVPANIIEVVESHFIIGAEALLDAFISSPNLSEEYFKKIEFLVKNDTARLGLILFTVSVMKRLVDASPETRDLWLFSDPTRNIIQTTFRILSECHIELSQNIQINIRSQNGEPSLLVDLYEYVLCHLANVILTFECSQFQQVEQTLLGMVLQKRVWNALFAIDLWCILSRYGPADLCYDQFRHMLGVYAAISQDHNRPERVFVGVLLARLYPLLAAGRQIEVARNYEAAKYPHLWMAIGMDSMPMVCRQIQVEALMKLVIKLSNQFAVQQDTDIAVFNEMCKVMLCLATVSSNSRDFTDACVISSVMEIWERLVLSPAFTANLSNGEKTVTGSNWLNHLIISLCRLTEKLIGHMASNQIHMILQRLMTLQPVAASNVKLATVAVLRAVAHKELPPGASDHSATLHLIATLFQQLLCDKLVLVRQSSLEAFDHFAHVTPHETVVAATVAGDPTLQNRVASYLTHTIPSPSPPPLPANFFSTFQHSCCETTRDHGDSSLLKKIRLDHDYIRSVLQRLHADVAILGSTGTALTPADRETVKEVIQNLHKLV